MYIMFWPNCSAVCTGANHICINYRHMLSLQNQEMAQSVPDPFSFYGVGSGNETSQSIERKL